MNKEVYAQGGLANKQGKFLEATVCDVFQRHGFAVVSYSQWCVAKEKYGNELLLRDVPYKSIYGHNGKTEFCVLSERFSLNARIECKWQQSSGSVDEKFPYLYLNCINAMPEDLVIIIIDGGGAKPSAVEWLKNAARERKFIPLDQPKKRVEVFSIGEFIAWTNTRLR